LLAKLRNIECFTLDDSIMGMMCEYLMTPLHGLALKADNVYAVPCAQLLLDHGVDVTLKNTDGMTALDYAKREKAPKEFQALLKKAEKKKR